jgi:hypothetical protein
MQVDSLMLAVLPMWQWWNTSHCCVVVVEEKTSLLVYYHGYCTPNVGRNHHFSLVDFFDDYHCIVVVDYKTRRNHWNYSL